MLVQDFFLQRLTAQRGASRHTIASYRDTFELLLRYAETTLGRTPSDLTIADLDAPLVLAFLDYLETKRHNCPRSRNLRLTAIRSFMRYVSLRDPTALPVAQRILAIPSKRFDRPVLGFLSRQEVQALLDAPDRSTWSGQRDAVLFAVLYNTGARVVLPQPNRDGPKAVLWSRQGAQRCQNVHVVSELYGGGDRQLGASVGRRRRSGG
jgi:site-specific recombinase XerD